VLNAPPAAPLYRASGFVLWRKADIPFEIVSTSDKKVAGNGMRMRAIADGGPGNRAPPIYSRGLRQPLPSMTRLAPARSSQT
jgi:hypothetical protein